MILAAAAALTVITASAPPVVPDDVWRYRDWPVHRVEIVGVDRGTATSLREGLALAADGAKLYPSHLEEDLTRTRLFLARRGHGDPRVRVTVRPGGRNHRVIVTLHVESRAIRVEFLRFEGTLPSLERVERDLRTAIVGRAFADATVDSAVAVVRDELREAGHALAEVEPRVERTPSGGAGVTLTARPGAVFYWGDTIVVGAADDLVPLVRRVSDLGRGDRFRPRDVDDAEENLRLLGLFGRIQIAVEPAGPDTLETRIEIGARKPRSVTTGLGYWTDEGIRGGLSWEHRNFFHGGRSLGAGAVASQYKQEGFLSTRWPALVAPRVWTEARLSLAHATEDNYRQRDVQASLANRWWFTGRSWLLFGVGASHVKVDGRLPDFDEERDDLVIGLRGQLLYDGSDDILRPTQGRKLNVTVEWAPAGISGSEYVIGEIEGVHYLRLPASSVHTTRVLVGAARRLGRTESLLPDRRFYSGGASSHRGFERRRLGPLDADGNPVGGEVVLNASLDLRFPIFRALRGALFVDAGQVWARPEGVSFGDIEVAIGPGLWFDTPVGPFRFDVGFRLTDMAPTPREAYHIAIGKPF